MFKLPVICFRLLVLCWKDFWLKPNLKEPDAVTVFLATIQDRELLQPTSGLFPAGFWLSLSHDFIFFFFISSSISPNMSRIYLSLCDHCGFNQLIFPIWHKTWFITEMVFLEALLFKGKLCSLWNFIWMTLRKRKWGTFKLWCSKLNRTAESPLKKVWALEF